MKTYIVGVTYKVYECQRVQAETSEEAQLLAEEQVRENNTRSVVGSRKETLELGEPEEIVPTKDGYSFLGINFVQRK